MIGPCAAVSLVGRNIRAILHRLGDALELFEEQKVYLVTQAANDLNFTFVIDEEQGDRLVERLHEIAIRKMTARSRARPDLGRAVRRARTRSRSPAQQWWQDRRDELLALGREHGAAFVYDRDDAQGRGAVAQGVAGHRRACSTRSRPTRIRRSCRLFDEQGLGFECVSRGEVEHVLATLPGIDRKRILFTPNFAPRAEYEWALAAGRLGHARQPASAAGTGRSCSRAASVFVRIDTGYGRGHHDKVRTAGVHSKFGVPLFELDELERLVKAAGAKVVGLHAHTGSGVFNVDNWKSVGDTLTALTQRFPDVRTVDLGGGLGVPERLGSAGRRCCRSSARRSPRSRQRIRS